MSSVIFLPHVSGIEHIPRAIIEKVEAREQLTRDFQRCIAVHLCPKCGDNLIVKHSDDENDWETLYNCAKCHFQFAKH